VTHVTLTHALIVLMPNASVTAMTRYRLRCWLPDAPNAGLKIYWRAECKLCAIGKVMDMAETLEYTLQVEHGTAQWSVESLKGVVDRWEIIYHDRMPRIDMAKRHGH
jgi:hypothetical protein